MLTDATDILQVIQYSPLGLAASNLNEILPKLKLGVFIRDKYQYLFILCKIFYSFSLFECTICILQIITSDGTIQIFSSNKQKDWNFHKWFSDFSVHHKEGFNLSSHTIVSLCVNYPKSATNVELC